MTAGHRPGRSPHAGFVPNANQESLTQVHKPKSVPGANHGDIWR
jgi:hypothetical protein